MPTCLFPESRQNSSMVAKLKKNRKKISEYNNNNGDITCNITEICMSEGKIGQGAGEKGKYARGEGDMPN